MDRLYTYHQFTRSICNHCDQMLDGKIVIENNKVYLHKTCPVHGEQKNILEHAADYYLKRYGYDKPGTISSVQTPVKEGCPFDCGLCPSHDQHTCIGLVEITKRCNMNCPVCYAHSQCTPDLTLAQIESMMDFYQASEGHKAEILQISGGEPTLHLQIKEILDMAMSKGFKYVMLNTNGLALLENKELVQKITSFKSGFEIYLQFDGFYESGHFELRGMDPTVEKRKILELLKEQHIPTTLVVTVEERTNLSDLGSIIQWAMNAPMVRGINFQPLAYYHKDHPAPENRVTLTQILKEIETQTSGLVRMDDFIPLPCNVERIAINYMIKEKGVFTAISKKFDVQSIVPDIQNTLSFKLEDLDASGAMCSCMKSLPKLTKLVPQKLLKAKIKDRIQFVEDNTFRLTVSSFIDRYNFDIKSAQKECVHIITPDLKRMPFSTYNMLHRRQGDGE